MKKRFNCIFLFVLIFFICLNSSYALNTYVGVEIVNLTDQNGSSCSGVSGYGSQGRIRAFSSILPSYPIFYNLTNTTSGEEIWAGDSTEDTDYTIGDVMFLPVSVDLVSGQNYTLFFDIDAIRVYINAGSHSAKSADNNYWTVGRYGGNINNENIVRSNADDCTYANLAWSDKAYAMYMVGDRNGDIADSANCRNGASSACAGNGLLSVARTGWPTQDFNINSKYDNLYQSTKGNFQFGFTFP
ncbi:MAG: hypothetical protein KC589_01870 [Nanoarchaeota archaeon]|nr:hypothetical protein [Nanoarchaeota archaeon]